MQQHNNNTRTRKKVLVVGCGNLGRWHIKGIEQSVYDVHVDAVDPDLRAIDFLANFIKSENIDGEKLSISSWRSLSDCLANQARKYDLVIVATLAAGRPDVVAEICESISFNYMLLEKPIAQSTEEIEMIEDTAKGCTTFVNHARRMMPWHKDIQTQMASFGRLSCEVNFPSLGIACNTSHYIDLVNWWTGELPKRVKTGGLSDVWQKAKRVGFWEAVGEIFIEFDGGSSLKIISGDIDSVSSITVVGKTKRKCSIDEISGEAVFDGGTILKGAVLPQSRLTGALLDTLCQRQECDLPTLSLAAQCNKIFTTSLLGHWNKCKINQQRTSLPIT